MAHIAQNKKPLISRVRRISGQVASLERAIEADDDCGVILQQVASIRGAVQGLMLQLMEGHLKEHVAPKDSRSDELEPVLAVLRAYLR
jgi:DNA-binding FrmR family transcriptional regulator